MPASVRLTMEIWNGQVGDVQSCPYRLSNSWGSQLGRVDRDEFRIFPTMCFLSLVKNTWYMYGEIPRSSEHGLHMLVRFDGSLCNAGTCAYMDAWCYGM